MSLTNPNPYELAARAKKSSRLAHVLIEHEIIVGAKTLALTARFVAACDLLDADWERAARNAGVNLPSQETRRQVLRGLAAPAILDAAQAALRSGEAHGMFEALAVGAAWVSRGLHHEDAGIVDLALQDVIAHAESKLGRAA